MESPQIKELVIALTILFIIVGVFILGFFLIYRFNQNKRQAEIENLNKEILVTQLEIQEQTFKNISQEIHDNIGQVLSLAKLNLNTMDITNEAELSEKITDSKNLVSKAIQDLRDLSRSMNTDIIASMSLKQAINNELELINKTKICNARLVVENEVQKMDNQKKLILFRIVQEALHNIIKHALAKNISVTLNYTGSKLELIIADDGKGFNLTPLNENSDPGFGMGIRNMHNRAKLINADFSMTSIISKGTEIKLILPLDK